MKELIVNKLHNCPDCGGNRLVEEEREYEFQYGPKPHAVMLKTKHPVTKCTDCGCAFFDHRGERARTASVNLYLDQTSRRL